MSARLSTAGLIAWCFVGVASASLGGCRGEMVTLGLGPNHGGSGGAGAGSSGSGGTAGTAPLEDGGGAAGSGGAGAVAGSGGLPGRLRFLDASPVTEILSEAIDDNPTLTGDLLEIFFTSERDGTPDVWMATRSTRTVLFGAPTKVSEASTDGVDTSPAISLDGLTLWVGQDRAGGAGEYDIWALERPTRDEAWSELFNIPELNSPQEDIPRPAGYGNRIMPLGSRRNGEGYRTYLAERATPSEPFGTPVIVSELAVPGESSVDGFLSEDGLTLFYSAASTEEGGDLYFATRPTLRAPFGAPVPITDLNTAADERDPWLSPDGTTLFFATNREGNRDIFMATVSRE